MKRLAQAIAFLFATAGAPSWAQSSVDHNKHHPDQNETPSAKQPAPTKGQSPLGSPGMTAPGTGMASVIGGGSTMNPMGGMMPMMHQSDDAVGMATIDRVEGRIAFLRAELKITDAQQGAWNAFADALRGNARSLGEVRSSMMAGTSSAVQQSLLDRLALQEKWLAARLDGTHAIRLALTDLFVTLSDDQRKTANELLAPHMGIMAMMQSGRVGSGVTPPGR
jgi:hypothetical protein